MKFKPKYQYKLPALLLVLTCIAEIGYANNADLIGLARQGNHAPAIQALQSQVKKNKADQNASADLVTILGWAGRWDEALLAASNLDTKLAPIYGVKSYGLAARRTGNLALALAQYDTAIARSLPSVAYDLQAARVTVLCEMGKCLQAVTEAEKLLENHTGPEPVTTHELLIALAKAYLALERKTEALAIYQRILQVTPKNAEIIKEQTFLLANLRAAKLAKQEALSNPQIFSEEGFRNLTHHEVSQQIRFGEAELGVYWSPEKFTAIQQAIQDGFKLKQSNLLAGDFNSHLSNNTAWDSLIALRDNSQATAVIEGYQQLRDRAAKSNTTFKTPGYAVSAVADSYLYNKQPLPAIALYQQALSEKLANEEVNTEWQISLVYAYLDNNDFEKAKLLMQEVLKATPEIKNKNIPGFETVNPVYTQWRVMEILVHLYSDELPKAQELIEKFRTIGSHNTEVRNANASLLQALGLNKAALAQYLELSVDYAHDASNRIGLANLLLANREYKLAREQIAEVATIFPYSGNVLRATKELAVHDSIEISTNINATDSDLNRPDDVNISNGKELRITTEFKSASINENYKIGGYVFDRTMKGLDKTIHDRILGVALHIAKPDYLATASINRSLLLKDKLGGTFNATWMPSDHWQFAGKIDLLSTDTPLRALDMGVKADVAGMSASYKPDDSSIWGVNTEVWRFSDTNRRNTYSLTQRQRLNYDPSWRIHSKLSAYYSTNTNSDVSYFSPKNDSLLEAEIEIDHLTWRDYEHSLRQHFWASIGSYTQFDFGTNTNWAVKYSHEWRNDPWWSLSYGIGLHQRHFNGTPEKHKFFFASGTRYF